MTQLTEHFTLEDVTRSATAERLGIDNSLPPELLEQAIRLLTKMEKVRIVLNNYPIRTSSIYRCLELNRTLKSKDTSQHLKCEAVDFISPKFGTPLKICKALLEAQVFIVWDQLILEHTWVHISWNSIPGRLQRGEVLSLLDSGNFAIGLTDRKGNKL